MAERTTRIWALILAAVVGLSGAAARSEARGGLPKKPGVPKPLGTPKSPVKLPALAQWAVATPSHASS